MGNPLLSLHPTLPLLAIFLFGAAHIAVALPLHTDSRWIVDGAGDRVKLACVNWVAHLDAVVAEGLHKQPLDAISKRIASMGFNCVRLTWPISLMTNATLAKLTVRQSLTSLRLTEALAGFQSNNPKILDLSIVDAFKGVVASLGVNNVMVILDNHISRPGWCCSNSDGNGFFGDKYFDPNEWLTGLTRMATMFRGTNNVVGMSLRNELRGPNQSIPNWYRYMQKGAEAVHSVNQDVLVILSGLNFDNDLSFLSKQPTNLTFTGKLVFELHWYGFSDGQAWLNGNPNQVCGSVEGNVRRRAGYLLDKGFPLFVSEFGADERGGNVNDNRYLNCFFGVAADLDFDWALWTLVGDYYYREGVVGMEEFYGILNSDWSDVRNTSFSKRIAALQPPLRGPGQSEVGEYSLIFHPSTGQCVQRKSTWFGPLKLGPCSASEAWDYTPRKTLAIKGTMVCLQAGDGIGKAARLAFMCSASSSKWDTISDSRMHLSSKLSNGTQVCLDVDTATNTLVVRACTCLSRDNTCDPAGQWFRIVKSTRGSVCEKPISRFEMHFGIGELLPESDTS